MKQVVLRTYIIIGAVVLLGVAVVTTVAQAGNVSIGRLSGQAVTQLGARGEQQVVTVNGEGIPLRELEVAKTNYLHREAGSVTEQQAYQNALNYVVQQRVLVQEAQRRKVSVSDAEVQQYVQSMWADAEKSPEMKQFLQDQQQALGVSNEAYNALLSQTVKQGLLSSKLTAALSQEVTAPTEDEVSKYLDRQPGYNSLTLIPIYLADRTSAENLQQKLQAQQWKQTTDQFTTVFDSQARQLSQHAVKEFAHETFNFKKREELPDYAQTALGQPEQSIVLFARPDGTAVVSLVLHSVSVTDEQARAQAKQTLLEQKQSQYTNLVQKRLVEQAKITVNRTQLPAAAQSVSINTK